MSKSENSILSSSYIAKHILYKTSEVIIMTMNWNDLLSTERVGDKIVIDPLTEERYPRSEFEKDYRRIISSASFRRLQDKTQVFPLDQSDFVRTRLTHSYEVAALAKTLGIMLPAALAREEIRTRSKNYELSDSEKEKTKKNFKELLKDVPDILACAGLLHDIGNPPFGHFGEEIIKKWFFSNLKNFPIKSESEQQECTIDVVLQDIHFQDLACFDGNAQALRVLTKLHFQDSDDGLNLTSAVLNTIIKYPTSSDEIKTKDVDGYTQINKKMGYNQEDIGAFKAITSNTGAEKNRHPLTFLLEAADDIAYKTADIEDGYKKGLYTLDELLQYANACIKEIKTKRPKYAGIQYVEDFFGKLNELRGKEHLNKYKKQINNPDLYAIQNWVPYAQEWLLYCAVYGFEKHYNSIMSGTYNNDLFYETNHQETVKIIDKIMRKYIFPNRSIVKLELAASETLSNLLDKFVSAVLYYDKKYSSIDYVEIQTYERLYGLISENYRETYKRALEDFKIYHTDDAEIREYDIYLRLLLVADYISGMTDSYAKSLYQELNGINGLSGIY
jgi:deoxyguanosinetriphosphate triphosphohydrolase, putative